MKQKFLAIILACAPVLFSPGCRILRKAGLVPSELEMIMGLKDALSQGLFKGLDAFANPEGNPLYVLFFPTMPKKLKKPLEILISIKSSIK